MKTTETMKMEKSYTFDGAEYRQVPFPDFDRLYVSRDGKFMLYTIRWGKWREYKPKKSKSALKIYPPYLDVACKSEKTGALRHKRAARAVYEAFIGSIPDDAAVGFKDGDGMNIRLDNLFLKKDFWREQVEKMRVKSTFGKSIPKDCLVEDLERDIEERRMRLRHLKDGASDELAAYVSGYVLPKAKDYAFHVLQYSERSAEELAIEGCSYLYERIASNHHLSAGFLAAVKEFIRNKRKGGLIFGEDETHGRIRCTRYNDGCAYSQII